MTHPYERPSIGMAAASVALSALSLLHPRAAVAAEPLQPDALQLEASMGWDDNLTRAGEAPSRLGDRIHSVTLSRAATLPLAPHWRSVFSGFVSADKLARYEGLDRASAGLSVDLQYRPSAAFRAPTYALTGQVQHDEYRSGQRTGQRFFVGASVRQPLTDRITAFAAIGHAGRDARDAAFDTRERSLRLHLDYAAGRLGTFYAGAEHRRGDVVSTSWGYEAEYAHPARAWSRDEAFGPGYFAYRLGGRTTLGTLGWSLPLGPQHALDVSWRHAVSKASIPADPAGAYDAETFRYRSNLYSVAYLLRF